MRRSLALLLPLAVAIAGCGAAHDLSAATTPLTGSSSCVEWTNASELQRSIFAQELIQSGAVPAQYHSQQGQAELEQRIIDRCLIASQENAGLLLSEAVPQETTTTATNTQATSAEASSSGGAPAFTVHATSSAGDRVRIEGRLGPVIPATELPFPEEEADRCVVEDLPRDSAVQLSLTATVESGSTATVETTNIGSDPFAPDTILVTELVNTTNECGIRPGVAFGELAPHEPDAVSTWLILMATTTPRHPHPSMRYLAERWRLTLPVETKINDTWAKATISGPRVEFCGGTNNEPSFISVTAAPPSHIPSDSGGSTETLGCHTG